MKKRVFSLVLALLVCAVLIPAPEAHAASNTINVYNWGQYISDGTDDSLDVIKAFEEETGIKVNYLTFDSNESMYTKLKTGGTTFDVIIPSDYMIAKLISEDMLEPLDFANIPNYEYIDEAFRNQAYDPENTYSVPYTWGTVGLIYNKNYVSDEDAESWSCLWNSKYQGKLLMKDSYRDSYGTALIWAHRKDLEAGKVTIPQLMNDYSPAAVATVEKELKALKPNIEGWEADFGKETMTKGKAYLNMTWSGDAVWAIEEAGKVGVELGYEVPKEGSNVWFDGWVIPKYSRNPKAAAYFINYLCQEDVALANMETTGYVSSVAGKKVLEAMSDTEAYPQPVNLAYFFGEEGRNAHLNPIMYPDSSIVARCAMIHDAGDHTPEVLDMWSKVKGDNLGGGIVIFLLAVVLALTVFVAIKKYEHYKHRRLSRKHRRRHVVKVKG